MTMRSAARLSLLSAALVCGCGGGAESFDVAPVRGIVMCEGEAVAAGTISFAPISADKTGSPGKSATGVVGADGTFVLTTYEEGDGAIIGRHKVYYTPPAEGDEAEVEEDEEGESSAAAPAATPLPADHPCAVGGQAEAEVVDGENDLIIELTTLSVAESEEEDEGDE